jgi:tetratricopeptide (TPR) repeat protein
MGDSATPRDPPPDDEPAYGLWRDGRAPDEAVAVYREALAHRQKLAADFPEEDSHRKAQAGLYVKVGNLLSLDLYAEAAEEFRQALRFDPGDVNALNGLAWTLVVSPDAKPRDLEQAVRLATKGIASDPKHPGTWNTLGVARYRLGDMASARTALEKSVEFQPPRGVAADWIFLAMVCWRNGEEALARQWYDKVARHLEQQPDDSEARRFRDEADALFAKTARP